MSAPGTPHRHPPHSRAASATPGRACSGFTLVETVVALAVAGAVFLPAVALVQRLLAEDRRLDAQVADNLRRRAAPVVIPTSLPDHP